MNRQIVAGILGLAAVTGLAGCAQARRTATRPSNPTMPAVEITPPLPSIHASINKENSRFDPRSRRDGFPAASEDRVAAAGGVPTGPPAAPADRETGYGPAKAGGADPSAVAALPSFVSSLPDPPMLADGTGLPAVTEASPTQEAQAAAGRAGSPSGSPAGEPDPFQTTDRGAVTRVAASPPAGPTAEPAATRPRTPDRDPLLGPNPSLMPAFEPAEATAAGAASPDAQPVAAVAAVPEVTERPSTPEIELAPEGPAAADDSPSPALTSGVFKGRPIGSDPLLGPNPSLMPDMGVQPAAPAGNEPAATDRPAQAETPAAAPPDVTIPSNEPPVAARGPIAEVPPALIPEGLPPAVEASDPSAVPTPAPAAAQAEPASAEVVPVGTAPEAAPTPSPQPSAEPTPAPSVPVVVPLPSPEPAPAPTPSADPASGAPVATAPKVVSPPRPTEPAPAAPRTPAPVTGGAKSEPVTEPIDSPVELPPLSGPESPAPESKVRPASYRGGRFGTVRRVSFAADDDPTAIRSKLPPRNVFEAGKTAARVGDEVITLYELRLAVAARRKGIPEGQPLSRDDRYMLARVVLNDLIDKAVVVQEAKRELKNPKQLQVFMEQADKLWTEDELPPLLRQTSSANVYELRQKLEERGDSLDDIRKLYRQEFLFRGFLEHKIGPKMRVDLPEMREYYAKHQKDYDRPAQVTWREILVEVDRYPDRATARRKADAALARVVRGDDFAAVAKAESDGPNRSDGGLWRTSPGGYAVPAVNAALETLPVGRVGAVIEGPTSYHVVRVEDRRAAGPASFAEVQDKVRQTIRSQKVMTESSAYLEKLRSRTVVSTVFDDPGVTRASATVATPPTKAAAAPRPR